MSRFKSRSIILLGVLLTATGCSSRDERPDVLLVVVDGCRPDKLGSYGFGKPTSPAIDALAADPDSVVFERHYVQADWTKPSTASLFTGLYVYQHRVAVGPEPVDMPTWSAIMPDDYTTMAERFQHAGYFTFGAVTIPHLLPKYGFDQGFEQYGYYRSDAIVRDETLKIIENAPRPFFGYLHLLGCHNPYPQYDRDAAYMEEFGFEYDEDSREGAGVNFSVPVLTPVTDDAVWNDDDVRFLHLIHEAKLRKLDRTILEPLFERLREEGAYDDTLLVVTADHGQELLEHGGTGHGHALWEEVVHVPLLIKFPAGRRPRELGPRWTAPTRAIDLYPTLLTTAGVRVNETLPGVDLSAAPEIDLVLAERAKEDVRVDAATIRGKQKILHTLGEPPAVFDLAQDPGETRDLAATSKEAIDAADRAVLALRSKYPIPEVNLDPSTPQLTDEQREALRSLGYIE